MDQLSFGMASVRSWKHKPGNGKVPAREAEESPRRGVHGALDATSTVENAVPGRHIEANGFVLVTGARRADERKEIHRRT